MRHFLEIEDLDNQELERLIEMGTQEPSPARLRGLVFLSAFFQQSTRTRLGFCYAAARQGAAVIDLGGGQSLRVEPIDDQIKVLTYAADLIAIRHSNDRYAQRAAERQQGAIINAGAGATSHPSQALIDILTIHTHVCSLGSGPKVLLIGDPELRSARSLKRVAHRLGILVREAEIPLNSPTVDEFTDLLDWCDVVYLKPTGTVDYTNPDLNRGTTGRALPEWMLSAIVQSGRGIMHALPRGLELPDWVMSGPSSLVDRQIEVGLNARSAILRWLLE